MSEPIESIEFSEQDKIDLANLAGDAPLPQFHTVLEVWREVLKPARTEAGKRVTASWASKIVQSYPEITFAQMAEFRDRYYGKIEELYQILLEEIASDDECLSYRDPAEDAAENAEHYKNLLTLWQQRVLSWELAWVHDDPMAGVELGAIAEVHKMFFSNVGIAAFLDNIKFEFTEDDQQQLAEVLEEQREAAS